MPRIYEILLIASFSGLSLLSTWAAIKGKRIRLFLLEVFFLATIAVLLYRAFAPSRGITAKGETDLIFVVVLYFSMLGGMLASYAYQSLMSSKRKSTFKLGQFVAPILASPIVFIPLLAAMQSAAIDLRIMTSAKLMIFLVAFENGFFWKHFFDHRQHQVSEKTV